MQPTRTYSRKVLGTQKSVSTLSSFNSVLYHERAYPGIMSKRDSSSSLVEEDTTDADDSSSSKVLIQEQSSFQFEGVRFTPKVIEFSDAFEGKQFLQKIRLQNVGKNPVYVKIGEPSSFVFHMNKHDRCAKLLPSGRSITRCLGYVYHNDHLVQRSQIRVQINGRTIDYPIVVRNATPAIEVQPSELNFKVINMGASAKTLKLTLINSGGRGTKFAIDLGRNELDLVVNPPRGTIRAKSQITVYVEMVGLTEGEFYREMWITTNEKPIRVPVIAEVMRPRLEVYHPNATGDFTLINFPPTFYGTQRLDTIILRNFSADLTPFVIFAETESELKSCKDARKYHTAFKMFTMSSEEGRLEPFESRIVTINFKPMKVPATDGWHHKKSEEYKKNISNEILVFYRINRVHCVERKELEKPDDQKPDSQALLQKELDKRQSIMISVASIMAIPAFGMNDFDVYGGKDPDIEDTLFSNSAKVAPLEDKDVVRLCLHGEACEPELLIQPKSFHFQNVSIGKTEAKVLRLSNISVLPVKYKIQKVVNIKVEPKEGWLKPKEAVEVAVSFTPTFSGKIRNSIKVEIFGESAVLLDNDRRLVRLKVLKVNFFSMVPTSSSVQKPKITMGISPELTNEVGTLSELATFGSAHPKPYSAVLGALSKKFKPKWMIKETDKINNLENALIAFPNDRPRNYQSWPAKKVCRSIFTGNFRYSPPVDESYALTPEELSKKNENHRIWNEYIRRLSRCRNSKDVKKESENYFPKILESCTEFSYSNNGLNKLELVDPFDQFDQFDQFGCLFQKENNLPKLALIPLSPIFLCNIKVEPKLIDFGMVAPNNSVSEILKLHNMNSFPVSVRFIPGKSGVTLPNGDTRSVPPHTKKMLPIAFKTKDFGRYNGFLDYVINGSHQFRITVSANVVPKNLIIRDEELNLDFGNYPSNAAFQPSTKSITLINNLRSPIKFHWELPNDSPFGIQPLSGEVQPLFSLMNHIYFKLHPDKSYFGEANLISESGAVQQVKLHYRKNRISAYFLTSKIEVKEIALNLVETICPTIRNVNYFDVAFEVVDDLPMPGVKISPSQGIIKARSTFDLKVEIQIPVIIDFQFDVKVRIQQGPFLSLKICGSVKCPMVRIIPMEVTMRRISAQSFDLASMCVENYGTTPAHIQINLKEYPEYRISRKKDKMIDALEEEGILLQPRKSLKFFVHFQPNDVARYQFYLPIKINGILGPPMLQDSATESLSYYLQEFENLYREFGDVTRTADLEAKIPCACINCTVAGHMLKFSTMDIVFQKLFEDKKFQEEEFEITNIYVVPLTLCIRTDDVNHKHTPFGLEVVGKKVEYHSKSVKVVLQVDETVTFRAEFKPVKAGEYSIELPVFVKGSNEGYAYNFISLSGELKISTIFAEVNEIHFPPVPLRIGTEARIQVFAEGYKSPDTIACGIFQVEEYGKLISDVVKLVWLDEPKITGTQKSQTFNIQVSFQSSYPISLRTFLVFWDSKGEYFPVLFTAITDNCTLTNHLFLSTRYSKYKLIRDSDIKVQDEKLLTRYVRTTGKYKSNEYSDKKVQDSSKKQKGKGYSNIKINQTLQSMGGAKVEFGPKLILQTPNSIQRTPQLNFVAVRKPNKHKRRDNVTHIHSNSIFSHTDLLNDSTKTPLKGGKGAYEAGTDVCYPLFPEGEDSFYEKYLTETLHYVELWVYEVAFHCEEYLTIPTSFQMAGSEDEPYQRYQRSKEQKSDVPRKTIIDLLAELAGPRIRHFFPDKPLPPKDSPGRVEYLFSVFYCLLHFLYVQGCFLPHVRPENLLCYNDYLTFMNKHSACETLECSAGFPNMNSYRGTSTITVNPPYKGSEKEDVIVPLGPDIWIGSLNDAWNKPVLDDNLEDELYEFRERKNVEIDDGATISASSFLGKREQSADYGLMKDFVYKTEVMDEKTFTLRSTQAWLDVIIQIFRSLVLPKIVFRKMSPVVGIPELEDRISIDTYSLSSPSVADVPKGNQQESMASLESYENNNYTNQERILLSWLNYHFDLQRTLLWSDSSQSEQSEEGVTSSSPKVDSFRTDLSDSLVLMAVTASHCPYLIPNYFVDVFTSPENHEQKYHNATKLTSAWREVNIGLTVDPRDIIQSNTVFMLMLVLHLYDILPMLCPRSLIRFSAPLTEEIVKTILLSNDVEEKITYEAKFIGNQEGSFRLVNSPTIILKGRKRTEFKIAYRARRIHKVSVTLLLDGASVSPNFARSLVFHLDGEPSELAEFTTIRLHGSLYKVICLELPITPPYEEEASYEISYSTVSTNDPESRLNSMKPWREIWNRKTSRRLFINQNNLLFDGKSPAVLNVAVGCLTPDSRKFWLLFRSIVGDFIVRIDVHAKVRDTVCGPITVLLPKTWSKGAECTCNDIESNLSRAATSYCPLLCHLKVPSRNNYLWNTMFVMFQKTLDSKEKVFWKQHFETNIGIRLIKWLFSQDESPEDVDEFILSLRTNVTYSLKVDSNAEKYIVLPPTLEIADVRSEEPVYLPIHVSSDTPCDLKVTLTMTSESKKEIRFIKYIFQKPAKFEGNDAPQANRHRRSTIHKKNSKSSS